MFKGMLLRVGLLALSIFVVNCGKEEDAAKKSKTEVAGQTTPETIVQGTSGNNYFKTQFQDESQFIVEAIVSDLAELAFYAKEKKLPPKDGFRVKATEKPNSPFRAPVYDLEISFGQNTPALALTLNVNGPIWSPKIYKELTAAVFDSLQLTPPAPSTKKEDISTLIALADGKVKTIEDLNQSISEELQDDFTNSMIHERAAAVLGAFALRDSAGDFVELRSPLSRITAHLAFASQLSGGKSFTTNGKMADVMLSTLMNNQREALEKLGEIKTENTFLKSWIRVLNARNTGDYRLFAKPKDLSLFERIAWFRAAAHFSDSSVAWSELREKDLVEAADYARIAMAEGYSVEIGHVLHSIALSLELQEAAMIYELASGKKLTGKTMVEEFNRPPERCFRTDKDSVKVQVIGWGQWANFFQRHICQTVQRDFNFLQKQLGLKEDASSFSAERDKMFGGLRLYPLVRRFNCTDSKTYHQAVNDGFNLTVATPHLVSAEAWNYLCYNGPENESYRPNPNPHLSEWHKHNPPPGTAYNPLPRMNHQSLMSRNDTVRQLEALHAMAPHDDDISWNLMRVKYGGKDKASYDQIVEIYQPVLEYSVSSIIYCAEKIKDQPERYEQMVLRAAKGDPAYYYTLRDYFIARNEEDKAATYCEKGLLHDPDRVSASNRAGWMVKYYMKKGEVTKAKKLADEAGEIYSSSGLSTKAWFLEETGKYAEAFEWYRKIEERYEDSGELLAFCKRYKEKTGDTRYEKEVRSRLKDIFPRGIEEVTLQDFGPAEPQNGVEVRGVNDLVREAGLKYGDVIVACFGIRTTNFEQYDYARESRTTPQMNLIVWQNGQYREIVASPPGHRFRIDMGTYKKR